MCDLDRLSSQAFDVNSQDRLDVFEMKSRSRVLKDRVRCPSLEREIATTRFWRIVSCLAKTGVDPLFKLFEVHASERRTARSESRESALGIGLRDHARQLQDPAQSRDLIDYRSSSGTCLSEKF